MWATGPTANAGPSVRPNAGRVKGPPFAEECENLPAGPRRRDPIEDAPPYLSRRPRCRSVRVSFLTHRPRRHGPPQERGPRRARHDADAGPVARAVRGRRRRRRVRRRHGHRVRAGALPVPRRGRRGGARPLPWSQHERRARDGGARAARAAVGQQAERGARRAAARAVRGRLVVREARDSGRSVADALRGHRCGSRRRARDPR